MNIDKVKTLRYVSLIFIILGICNKLAGHYGYSIPDTEIDFYADIVSAVSTLVFGITLDSTQIKNLFRGKQGL